MTAPMHVDYRDLLREGREADAIPQIEHTWLFDHLMPIGGDPNGSTKERCSRPSPRRPNCSASACS
jgi:hypothetical protein